MAEEERMKQILNDLFEKHGIIDENIQNDFIDKLFEARVIDEMVPEVKVDILKLEVVQRGHRGCLIFDGRYYYILPYKGKAFGCEPDEATATEDFRKYEKNEEI